jgi:hypothetical protein
MPTIKQLFGANFHLGTVGKVNRKSMQKQNNVGDGNQAKRKLFLIFSAQKQVNTIFSASQIFQIIFPGQLQKHFSVQQNPRNQGQ